MVNTEDKKTIIEFRRRHIPSIFKTDNTDCILFIEDLDFDICKPLLKGKKIDSFLIDKILKDYKNFSLQYSLNNCDSTIKEYLSLIDTVIDILKKEYKI